MPHLISEFNWRESVKRSNISHLEFNHTVGKNSLKMSQSKLDGIFSLRQNLITLLCFISNFMILMSIFLVFCGCHYHTLNMANCRINFRFVPPQNVKILEEDDARCIFIVAFFLSKRHRHICCFFSLSFQEF